METSLAPSPTAAVMGAAGDVLTMWTISAFCSGDIRQQMTAAQPSDRARKEERLSDW